MKSNDRLFSFSKRASSPVRTPIEFEKLQKRNRALLLDEMMKPVEPKQPRHRTGWLPGPLSYPWIFIAIGISDLVSPCYF